ncbi:glycosyltransferase family 1 protein [Frankia sp. EI5c]|uniref:glycosyltransferase family 4 protein n=1 Tax=Frankia sp. EI5c TaxID=683316 RepID=UPI0009FCB98B|nr:glycosyltransferase family 1 protein [Frankia sp. EI5c]
MRVVLDGTPLLGPRTGVGRYTAALLAELAGLGEADLDVAATAFTWRGSAGLAAALPPGVRPAARRVPARLLQDAWTRSEHPPTEWLTGPADVVHATNFVLGPLASARGVLTVHDLSYLRTPDTVSDASARYTTLVPRGLRRADAVLTPSQAVADEVIAAYRLDPALVTPTPLGVDAAWFDAAPPARGWLAARGLPERYLLFVGSAEPRKNLPALLAALRRLRADEPDTPPLALVGPPGWGPALDTAGLPAGAVVTVGYLDDAELRSVVAGAAALCFPSRYEGFGLPPLEALAAGTRVVAADIPAVREVVGGAAGVRLVPPGRPDDFADSLAGALRSALAEPADTDTTARGREHARAFTWRRTAELTAAVYRRVAG